MNQNGAQKGNVQSNDFWDNFGQKRTPSNSASMTSMSANNQVIWICVDQVLLDLGPRIPVLL